MKFLEFYRAEKVTNQGKLKIHWWVQRVSYRFRMLSEDILSFWIGRSQ